MTLVGARSGWPGTQLSRELLPAPEPPRAGAASSVVELTARRNHPVRTDLPHPSARVNRATPRPTTGQMERGLYIAASGMLSEMVRQDQLANDLANANTPGYKADRVSQHSFAEELAVVNRQNGSTVGRLGTGVQIANQVTDFTPQGLKDTGEPLDLAISGEGFFAVQTPAGVRYTRDGSFTADSRRSPGRPGRQRRARHRPPPRAAAPRRHGRHRDGRGVRPDRSAQGRRRPGHGHRLGPGDRHRPQRRARGLRHRRRPARWWT